MSSSLFDKQDKQSKKLIRPKQEPAKKVAQRKTDESISADYVSGSGLEGNFTQVPILSQLTTSEPSSVDTVLRPQRFGETPSSASQISLSRINQRPDNSHTNCGCSICHGGPSSVVVQRAIEVKHQISGPVIQAARLGEYNVSLVERALEVILDFNPHHTEADQLFFRLTKETDVDVAIALLQNATDPNIQAIANLINPGSIRQQHYPSGFRVVATNNRDDFVNNNQNPALTHWRCPGYGRAAHWALNSDVTIDHVVPVATHWNNTGRFTNRANRFNWYNDITNHVMLCRSCNSRKGSGGVNYNGQTGFGFSAV